MTVYLHSGDLPGDLVLGPVVAIDTETMGLNPLRDRLCLVQLSQGDGHAHLVQFRRGPIQAANLASLLTDPNRLKLFHFARFDLGVLQHALGVVTRPVFCTKIASRLVRTYTDRHGLKDLVKELLDVDLSKQNQSSDWGSAMLTQDQKDYAAGDVLYLHRLRDILEARLMRENRLALAQACFDFLPHRATLDLAGWADQDIFSHS